MPRPRKLRRIQGPLASWFYKPQGVPMAELRGVILSHDGLEALRLADVEGLDHEAAARMMEISRPTFTRLVAEARRTVATALLNGWALRIDGGDFRIADETVEKLPVGAQGRGWCGGRGSDE